MIVAVLVVSLALWTSYRLMFGDKRPPGRRRLPPAPEQKANGAGTSLGLEAVRDEGISSSGVWTALDELQLVRLLVDSASAERAAANSTDNSVSRPEHEDTT